MSGPRRGFHPCRGRSCLWAQPTVGLFALIRQAVGRSLRALQEDRAERCELPSSGVERRKPLSLDCLRSGK